MIAPSTAIPLGPQQSVSQIATGGMMLS